MVSVKPRSRKSPVLAAAESAAPVAPIALTKADPEFLGSLGQRVREIREQRGMARKLLASTARVSERYLAALESGEGNASVILLRRVAGALGVRLTDLLDAGESGPEQRQLRRFIESLPPERAQDALRRLMQDFGQDETVRRKRITLLGLRGAGKSTLGVSLAKAMRRPCVELDKVIEREAGMELSEVFLLYGQPGFRRIERRCLDRVISSQEDIVLVVGGGIVSEAETYNMLLLNCFTVWVKASPEEHMARVIEQGDMRPMAGNAEAMEDLRRILTSREALYAKADAIVDTSGSTVDKSLKALRQVVQAG